MSLNLSVSVSLSSTAIIDSGGLSKEDTVDLLDGLDLDFLTFGKGGVFQNLEDADFSFDDIGGFRLRGMSEIGLPEHTSQHMTDTKGTAQPHLHHHAHPSHVPVSSSASGSGNHSGQSYGAAGGGGDHKVSPTHKMAHGIHTRDNRSGSLGWFDANTFLNERDPFLVKTYANADFSSHLEGGRISPSRTHSFDATIPSSPVNIYTSDDLVRHSICVTLSLSLSDVSR
jgi:hypothetical protein